MITVSVDQLIQMVQSCLSPDRVPKEEEVRDAVDRICGAMGADAETRESVRRSVEAQRLIRQPEGFAVVEPGHALWVDSRRAETDPFYWRRYRQLLINTNYAPNVIRTMDRNTDAILDLMGDPKKAGPWRRRGLVMGDVQSGKTANYAALISKAADAGYKLVVLLTGTLERLRQQTQERLDEGFVGFDSSAYLRRERKSVHVGVGSLDARRNAVVFTSTKSDFRLRTMEQLGLSLNALREPALVVVKKNATVTVDKLTGERRIAGILENLHGWLRDHNSLGGEVIDHPILVIDDEADNASVNTASADDPTLVNHAIRRLLNLFPRSTYVGFTATPFANIFISPEQPAEMVEDDLFPRDFIYALESPTNYLGPARIFADVDGRPTFTRQVVEFTALRWSVNCPAPAGSSSVLTVDGEPCGPQTASPGGTVTFVVCSDKRPDVGELTTTLGGTTSAPKSVRLEPKRLARLAADMESCLPARHRVNAVVGALPETLLAALRAFLLVNAIRDLRGERTTHRSMLVNVTHFTAVQDQFERLLYDRLLVIKEAVANFAAMSVPEALLSPEIHALHEIFQLEYAAVGFDWEDVQKALHSAIQPVRVAAVNQRTSATALDYRAHKAAGLRVVAVGGNSLSCTAHPNQSPRAHPK